MFALVLDDSELNNLLVAEAIRNVEFCAPETFTRPEEALAFVRMRGDEINVVITDFDMPGMNGLEFIRETRSVPGLEHVPIVMVTSLDERNLRRQALEAGATDFLAKPFDLLEIQARVTNLVALDRARRDQRDRAAQLAREVAEAVAVIEAREREIVMLLMKAAEYRDTDTGEHVVRVAGFVEAMARALGFTGTAARELALASTMHDVGKIAVPDAILLKKGKLTPEERAEMERHTETGRRILDESDSDLVRLAREIAWSHHERWDGTGYPRRLAGEAIPLSGRIVAVADVFDALISERPYKKAWSPEEARAYLEVNAGVHFDPACVAAFTSVWPQVQAIARANGAIAA